jgi:hypothetical protein
LLKLASEAIAQLQDEVGRSLVKIRLAGLLGGLEMMQDRRFYDKSGIFVDFRC